MVGYGSKSGLYQGPCYTFWAASCASINYKWKREVKQYVSFNTNNQKRGGGMATSNAAVRQSRGNATSHNRRTYIYQVMTRASTNSSFSSEDG